MNLKRLSTGKENSSPSTSKRIETPSQLQIHTQTINQQKQEIQQKLKKFLH